jgi:hypothetical protein
MKSVLRIAQTHFTFAPLQSWLSVVGLLFLGAGLSPHEPACSRPAR